MKNVKITVHVWLFLWYNISIKGKIIPFYTKKIQHQNVNKIVNRNVNKNVYKNVSREPNFRYTTMLLKKMKENDKKMSAENPILGTQRYFGRK